MSKEAEHIRRAHPIMKSPCVLVKESGPDAEGSGEPLLRSVFHTADHSTGRMDSRARAWEQDPS